MPGRVRQRADAAGASRALAGSRAAPPTSALARPDPSQLNDDYYECLTEQTTRELLAACKAGKPPPVNKWSSLPMNGQLSCEGPLGKTTLEGKPYGPGDHCRPASDFKQQVDPASVRDAMFYQ